MEKKVSLRGIIGTIFKALAAWLLIFCVFIIVLGFYSSDANFAALSMVIIVTILGAAVLYFIGKKIIKDKAMPGIAKSGISIVFIIALTGLLWGPVFSGFIPRSTSLPAIDETNSDKNYQEALNFVKESVVEQNMIKGLQVKNDKEGYQIQITVLDKSYGYNDSIIEKFLNNAKSNKNIKEITIIIQKPSTDKYGKTGIKDFWRFTFKDSTIQKGNWGNVSDFNRIADKYWAYIDI